MFRFLVCLLPIVLALADPVPDKPKHYNIVSLLNPPYLQLKDGTPEVYEGFVVDLAEEFKTRMQNSHYKILLAPDQRYGHYCSHSHKWDGVMGFLIDGHADIAITDLTVTEQRSNFVDFSTPFIDTGVGILYVMPESNNIPFTNFEELVNQDVVKYGVMRHGSTYEFFKHSDVPLYQKALKYFKDHPEVLASSFTEGIQRVVDGAGSYAFIGEVTLLNKIRQQYPLLNQVGDIIVPRHYALALPKDSQRMEKLNSILQAMRDDGTLTKLKERWLIKDN